VVDHPLAAKKSCPKCGSPDYTFRSRKTIPAKENEREAVKRNTAVAHVGMSGE
jgi:hypothetical protein